MTNDAAAHKRRVDKHPPSIAELPYLIQACSSNEVFGITADDPLLMLGCAVDSLANEQRIIDILTFHFPGPILARAALLSDALKGS